jgi:hypothetical protein
MSRFPSGFTSEAIVKDAMSGDEADDEFSLSGLTTGAKRYASGGAATTAMPATLATRRTGRTRPSGEATQPMTDRPQERIPLRAPGRNAPPTIGRRRPPSWPAKDRVTRRPTTSSASVGRPPGRNATPAAGRQRPPRRPCSRRSRRTRRTGRTRPLGEVTQPMTDRPPRADSPPRAGAKRSADDWAAATAKLATGTTAKERAKDRVTRPTTSLASVGRPPGRNTTPAAGRQQPPRRPRSRRPRRTRMTGLTRPSGGATQPMTDRPPRADSPPRAGVKCSADDWAAAAAKLATGATAKERAKDRAATPIARTDEGGNPKAPLKSGLLPSATLVEGDRSWDDDEDELVVGEPATKEKGGRARESESAAHFLDRRVNERMIGRRRPPSWPQARRPRGARRIGRPRPSRDPAREATPRRPSRAAPPLRDARRGRPELGR